MAKRTIAPPATALAVAAFVAGLVAPAPAFADESAATVGSVDTESAADEPRGQADGRFASPDEFVGIFEAARRASGELVTTVTAASSIALAVPADGPGGCQSDLGPSRARLRATDGSPTVVWTAGAAAILTGAVIALAVRARRRLLRGADYW